jgi:hypothetical protein
MKVRKLLVAAGMEVHGQGLIAETKGLPWIFVKKFKKQL